MVDFVTPIRAEFARVVRKETKAEFAALRASLQQSRSDVAALKRENAEIKRELKRLAKLVANPALQQAPTKKRKVRFSAKGFASQRRKQGLSAVQMGSLLGVSDRTIALWEAGQTSPRSDTLDLIADLRKVGKTEIDSLLHGIGIEELDAVGG